MSENDLAAALGPLAPLYEDTTVTVIMVDAPDRVYVEREGLLEDTAIRLDSDEAIRDVIDAVLALGGVTLDSNKTIGETRFPDGARFLAVIPPTALDGPCLIIRRFFAGKLTWDDLIGFGVLTHEARTLLRRAIDAGVSMLIEGSTASGKSTLASVLAGSAAPDKRVIVVEAAHEVQVRHPRVVYLEAGGPTNVPLADVLAAGARMRPDYLLIGELLGPEALQALQIMGRGHSGILTAHATGPDDALGRLEAMCLMANYGLGLGDIRALIASALRLIVHIEKLPDGRRRILQITELRGVENDRFVLQPLLRYNPAEDRLEATGAPPGWESP